MNETAEGNAANGIDKTRTDAMSNTASAAGADALKELEFHWGEAYLIGHDENGSWWAGRRDRIGHLLTALSPDELHLAIRSDYEVKAVPRDLSAGDAEP